MTERTAGTHWQSATIERLTHLTPRVLGVQLRPERWPSFLPGQHVEVQLTAPDGYTAFRPYSIVSAPHQDPFLELAIEDLPDGEVSGWFHAVARTGDVVGVRGPFATHFVWEPPLGGPLLLIAGGSGVAPFLSMVRHRAWLAERQGEAALAPMALLYSSRTWDDVIHRDELLHHAERQRGLQLRFCLTRDHSRRPGDVSHRIDADVLASALSSVGGQAEVTFVCGANRFVEAVTARLADAGVPSSAIRTERYGGG